jgi:hypothetical protein
MAKLKPARKDKKTKSKVPGGAIPCLFLLVSGIALLSLLFYSVLKSG